MYTSNRYGYLANKRSLSGFAKKNKQILQNQIFEKAFVMAQKCEEIKIDSILQACRHAVSKQIAQSIHEEELATPEAYNWPNDLFFVKRDGKTFHRIGWDGKWEDITKTTNTDRLDSNILLSLFPPSSNCNYFSSFQTQSGSACEYFEKIELGKNQYGFIVRQHPITEEDYYLFLFLFFIPLSAINLHDAPSLFFLLSPALIALGIVYIFHKKTIT